MDPLDKASHPYDDIMSKNILLNTQLLAYNIGVSKSLSNEDDMKCGPPDGVPLWEWIPAVVCRLKDMLPPKIKISDGQCSDTLLSEEELEQLEICNGDVNKNGVNDCSEKALQ